jgi:hypothetical protein
MSRWLSRLAAVAAAFCAASPGFAQRFEERLVDPFEAKSPSGSYVLRVDPSEPLGWKSARYELKRDGEVLWAKELDCTLQDVVVGDNGICAGSAHRVAQTGGLELVLLLIGRDGTQLFQTVLPPERGYMHGPDFPYTQSNLLMPEQDRVVFRTSHHDWNRGEHGGDSFEVWRVVSCSTGKEIAKYEPASQLNEPRGISRFAAVQRIRGTPLVAVHALVLSFDPPVDEHGATFAVLDLDGKPVWERREAHDYEFSEDEEADRLLWPWIAKHGALLDCDAPGRFEFALVQEGKRVLCEASADPDRADQWNVNELARSDYELPFQEVEETEPDDYPAFPFELVGTIELQGAGGATERFWKFDIDDRGRLGAIVTAEGELPRFVLREPDGDFVADVTLQLMPTEEPWETGLIWLKGDRWLVHASELGDDARAHAWWIDLPSGVPTEIQDFECAPIDKADGTLDGGFVALTSEMVEYTIIQTLSSFDAEGRLRWQNVVAYGQSDSGLFSPDDVAVSPKSEIGVLDNIKDVIQRFDLAGKLAGEIDLAQALSHDPGYPTELGVDSEGNWIVYDSPLVSRITRDAELIADFTPSHADGRTFHSPDGFRAAPDGSLWASDGYALVHLDAKGVVDNILGEPPNVWALGEVDGCIIDHTGRILMSDLRTQSVHVFDAEGKLLAICKLDPEDSTDYGRLTVAPDLSIHVGNRRFAPNGVPLGIDAALGGVHRYQPTDGKRWEIHLDVLHLYGSDGTELKQITHSPDGRWLVSSYECAVGPEGMLVLSGRKRYHLFSPDGEPLRSLQIAPPAAANLALSTSHVFAVSYEHVWRTSLESGEIQRVKHGVEDAEHTTLVPAWREELRELWLANPIAKKVLRYRVK